MSTDDQQKRGGLVPIGDVAVRLPGIEGRGRAMSARARHHFTLLKQVNQLIEAGEGEPDLGFMARLLALCSLPRTNPRDRLQYERSNGPYKLCMIAGSGKKLPYGNLPRLLLAWVCSEAVRTQSRDLVLVLGRSLYEFMHKLGMEDRSGSPRGAGRGHVSRRAVPGPGRRPGRTARCGRPRPARARRRSARGSCRRPAGRTPARWSPSRGTPRWPASPAAAPPVPATFRCRASRMSCRAADARLVAAGQSAAGVADGPAGAGAPAPCGGPRHGTAWPPARPEWPPRASRRTPASSGPAWPPATRELPSSARPRYTPSTAAPDRRHTPA